MTVGVKMSQTGKVSKRKWVLWGAVLVLLLVLAGAFMAWHYRYNLLERKVRQIFDQNGFDIELEITSADAHRMNVENIELLSGGKPVFTASHVELEYDYKHALKGEFERVVIEHPTMNITLDESGNISNDWFPKKSGGNDFVFPAKGLNIEDAVINWHAPFGHGKTTVSLDAKSATHWNLIYQSPGTVLSKDEVSLTLDLNGGAEQERQDKVTSFGSIISKALTAPNLQMGHMKTDYHFDFSRKKSGEIGASGWLNFGGVGLETEKYSAKTAILKLDIESTFDPKTNGFKTLLSHWKLQSEDVSVKNPAYRQQIAKRLTSYNALQKAPIAKHFSGILPKKLSGLLASFSARGGGDFFVNKDGYRISFTDGITLKSQGQSIEITSNAPNALLYKAQENTLSVDVNVDWSGANAVRISGLKAQGVSSNGFRLNTVNSLQVQLQSKESWRMQKQGHALRLAPFDIDLNYTQNNGESDIWVSGVLDYDGIVPGGVVKGLRAGGVLTAHTNADAAREFKLGFAPQNTVHMDSFISTSGWQAKDIAFTLPMTKTLIYATGTGREMLADLQSLQAQIISPAQDRHMDITAQNVQVKTQMADFPKVWNLDISGAVLRSNDFPSPGTHIRSRISQLVLEQSANGDLHFTSFNPGTFIETDNIRIAEIDVKMNGTPEKFTANYSAPKVEFKGGNVPILPVTGTATFDNGVLTGDAIANLRNANNNTPIDIAFSSQEGRGRVNIDIQSMDFTPNGLQPQFLVSSLKGKLAEVSGQASAQFELEFGGGGPIRSYGTIGLMGLDMGTLVGPIRGINTQLKFSSLFPLETDGVQNATLAGFDPGFPLDNGRIRFEIISGGVRIDEASWPIENDLANPSDNGLVFIEPMLWRFGNVDNLATVHIDNLELANLFEKLGKDKLMVTGKVTGILPAKINGVDVLVEGGKLEVKEGGIIQFKTDAANAAAQKNEYAGHGLKALENLTYKKMEALIDGPLDGSVQLNVVAEGYNSDVLSGQKFLFDVGVEGELANIARNLSKSFSTSENVKRVLELSSGAPE